MSSIKREDVESIFANSRLDEESLDFLYKIARSIYGIRGAVNIYVAAVGFFGQADVNKLAQAAKKIKIK